MGTPFRIHVAPAHEDLDLIGFLTFHKGRESDDVLFKRLPDGYTYSSFTLDASPEEADAILAPHPARMRGVERDLHVREAKDYAKTYGKPLIVFTAGDYQHDVYVKDAIVMKGAQYRYLLKPNEVLITCFVEDLSEETPLTIRKKGEKPSVGFCGYADPGTPVARLKYEVKNASLDMLSILTGRPELTLHKRGLYWRKKSMDLLKKDGRFDTHFITRSSFSRSAELISGNASRIRQEYLDNITQCDFALTPKGDANTSFRFFEILSLGRIPVLVDTEVVLPFEDTIDYDSFVIKIPYRDIENIGDILFEKWQQLSPEEFVAMQKRSREAFTEYLRYDRYFNHLFANPTFL